VPTFYGLGSPLASGVPLNWPARPRSRTRRTC